MRKHRRLRGGMNAPDDSFESNGSLHLSDLGVGDNTGNESNMDVDDQFQFENPDFSGDTTINTNDWSIENPDESIDMDEEDIHDLDMDADLDLSVDDSFGGKRRKTNKRGRTNKRRTNKRRTNKRRKTNKRGRTNKRRTYKKCGHKRRCNCRKTKRKFYGGEGFTQTITEEPIAYKEDEYDQLKNALNYK